MGVPRQGWFWGGCPGGFPRRGILRGFVGFLLCPWGLGEDFYVSFSGVPKWEGRSEGIPSKFRGNLCGVFWGVLRCWGAVLECLQCWGIKVQVYQDNRVLGCRG